jgi:hypothetical protein
MKIHKHCVANQFDKSDFNCWQCHNRIRNRKRICPFYSLLKKKDPVKLYGYLMTEIDALRKRIEELENTRGSEGRVPAPHTTVKSVRSDFRKFLQRVN